MSKVKTIGAPCVVNTKAFIEELLWAARFLETKSTIPILQNVLIEHTAGRIGLTGTDLELAGMTSLAPEHDGAEFSTAVPTKKLIAYLKKVDEPCVRLEVKDFKLTVSHGDASMAVHGMSKESYPVTPEVTQFVAKLAGLKTAIPRAEVAIADDESRFTLNVALLELKKEGPDMLVATNGHRLSMAGIKTDYGKDEVFRALLPRKLLHELWWLEVDQVDFYCTPVPVKTKGRNDPDRTVRLDCGNGRQIWARSIGLEVKRRNPIFVNVYMQPISDCIGALEEISGGEAGNFSSESGPTEPPKPKKPARFKCETHKLRKRREGTRLPYVCLECGKEFKILTGLLVARTAAEEDDYFKRRRELLSKMGV